MNRCDHARSLFGSAWEDELSLAERETLELHMQDCAGCRREYDELTRMLELVAELPRPSVSTDFAERVLAEAQRREAALAEPRSLAALWNGMRDRAASIAASWALPRPALAAAALLVVAGGTTFYLLGPLSHPGRAPRMASVIDLPAKATKPIAATHTTERAPEPADRIARTQSAPAPATGTPDRALRVASSAGTPSPSSPASAEPNSKPSPGVAMAASAASEPRDPVIADSLFDHTADVEFVLDPVTLKRERGRGYTPVTTPVRGQPASITF